MDARRPAGGALRRLHRRMRPSSCATATSALGGKGVAKAVEHVTGDRRGVSGLDAADQAVFDPR